MAAKKARIRMYRQGLGDCFLITLPGKSRPFRMLVDCGALKSKHYGADLMRKVVADIKAETGGKLDVLALTHEHWDHISGFDQAEDLFKTFKVSEVWTAWTENPKSDAAKALKKEFKKKKQAVATALARLPKTNGAAVSAYRHAIEELFNFNAGLGAAGAKLTETAWKTAMGLGKCRFCDPKEAPLSLDALAGVRFYVLGPPEDPDYVRRTLSKTETYDQGAFALFDSFMLGLDGGEDADRSSRARPFDFEHCIDPGIALSRPFFAEHYGTAANQTDAWRRIDHDWLDMAGELALHLDSYTNNTCLAFAIELGDSGKVLLFPGDAQVGNWLSWATHSWPVKAKGGAAKTVNIDDLLARTVFYKVGHHGSHNATLRTKGLEKMTSPDLVAMIPVHRPTAKDQKWSFPYPPLWTRLKEKARGRVLLADAKDLGEIADDAQARLTAQQWAGFRSSVKFTDLYVEHSISY